MRVLFLPGMALAMALIQPPAAPVFAQPADHIAASGDSLAGVDAPALSSEES